MFLKLKTKPTNQTNQTNQLPELGRIKSGKVARAWKETKFSAIFRSYSNSTKNHTNKLGGMKHHSAKKKKRKSS